jgi:hypothetical protein
VSESRARRRAVGLIAVSVLAITLAGGPAHAAASPVAWPGSGTVTTADGSNVFGEDVSGLYQEGSVLWAAQNSG